MHVVLESLIINLRFIRNANFVYLIANQLVSLQFVMQMSAIISVW